jgi:addiction module HigA family antidote
MATIKIKLTHPGRILREEFMEPAGLSAYALAKSLSVPLPRVNDIVREKRSISPEMAVLQARFPGRLGPLCCCMGVETTLSRATSFWL